MGVYYSKIASLHPEFPKEFKVWIQNDKSAFVFSPIDLNDRYSLYRKMSPVKEENLGNNIDYNEVVNDLLRMNPHLNDESSKEEHNYSFPNIVQRMEVLPRGALFSNIGLAMHEALKDEGKKLEQESICKMPSEDREISRILMESWKSDSRSRGMELIQQLHVEESLPTRSLSNLNAMMAGSRQSTILNDASKLLISSNPELSKLSEENGLLMFNDEKGLSTPLVDSSGNTSVNQGLLTDILMRNYFANSNINLNHTGGQA
eukprot:TRINITY_DN2428_c0_g1_i1.p2 TRINITY_DN2428_c0_g1~~TRINITY_DN2428_c0_g1_i1.p2  ORF type:complete len:261 (+),score=78.53 TRINITY_DN2428_c0_g1_i1:709-1491(+)